VSFASTFATEFHTIGTSHPVYVIAEAGVAHFGRFDLAEQLLSLAIEARADAFKLQVFDVDRLIGARAAAWKERLRPRVLPLEALKELRARCRAAQLDFVVTAHDENRIPWLEELDVSVVKVGSGERNNPRFVTALASLGRPMIVSTGMHREADVRESIAACEAAGGTRLALLHCVTAYPTPCDQVNLRGMDRLRELFPGPVGYSDHTPDGLAVLAAVARGAQIIEKHVTILRDVPNAQDWKVSAGPEDFPRLVADIRRVEQALGTGSWEPAAAEIASEEWALKSLVAVRDLPAGHSVTGGDVQAKRTGRGISPSRLGELVGRRLRRPIAADQPFAIEDVE
jgi:N,N'-diacetyllegionaminate synthase